MEKSTPKKKRVLKKVLIGSGIGFVLILTALILIPIFYKDEIKNLALKEVNKMLLADVAVKDFDLTIVSTFPKLTAQFDGITVTGRDTFDKVELVNIERFNVHLDFWSLFGEQFEIKGFSLDKPVVDVRVLKNGLANYDIVKPDSVKTPEEIEEPSSFKLALNHYEINNAHIKYDDRASNMFAELENFTHEGSGDLTADVIDFETKSVIDALTFKMDGMSYLSKVKTDLVANLLMEFKEKSSKFTLKENELILNRLKLSVDGFYEMFDDKSEMDLKLNTGKATFKDLLSLIPAFYHTGYESMVTNGSLALNAMVKGTMDEVNLPSWNAGLQVMNASVKYPDLPEQLKNIQIDAKSTFPGGSNLNAMTADVNKFHVDFIKNTVDATLKLRNIMTDPAIDTKIKAYVDLATLGKVIPLSEGENYNGILDADVALKGKMSSIEKERYEEFDALGSLILKKCEL